MASSPVLHNNIYFPTQENAFDRSFWSPRRSPRLAPPLRREAEPAGPRLLDSDVGLGANLGLASPTRRLLLSSAFGFPAAFSPFDPRDRSPVALIRPHSGMCERREKLHRGVVFFRSGAKRSGRDPRVSSFMRPWRGRSSPHCLKVNSCRIQRSHCSRGPLLTEVPESSCHRGPRWSPSGLWRRVTSWQLCLRRASCLLQLDGPEEDGGERPDGWHRSRSKPGHLEAGGSRNVNRPTSKTKQSVS